MMYNFDQIIERRNTNCVKWDDISTPTMLPLWVADMDFAVAPCIEEAVIRRAQHPCFGYTLVPDAYYEAIQHWFATRHQWHIETTDILCTIGVIPAIAAVLRATAQPGDKVVMLTPIYNHFYNLVHEAGCQAEEVPLLSHNSNGNALSFSIDWNRLEAALAKEESTTLLLCNPHNPVGRIWSKDELKRIAALCKQYDILIISDEIHCEITRPGEMYTPLATITDNDNWVVCGSPSKSFNIAGLQNAFIVCHNAHLRHRIDHAINLNEISGVNPLGVEALIAAYTGGGEWIDELREYIFSNYDYASSCLDKVPGLTYANTHGTYLMWVNVAPLLRKLNTDSEGLCQRLMTEINVRFSHGSMYGKGGEDYVRINLACPRKTLEEALQRFLDFWSTEM